jgi:D-glutamate cyclase-like protein
MAGALDPHTVVDDIERLIQTDVGRHVTALFEAARGGLWGAGTALGSALSARVGLITGFYVPLGSPPAAETDGPVGAALLAKGLVDVGIPCRLATDEPCRSACGASRSIPPMSLRQSPSGVAPGLRTRSRSSGADAAPMAHRAI